MKKLTLIIALIIGMIGSAQSKSELKRYARHNRQKEQAEIDRFETAYKTIMKHLNKGRVIKIDTIEIYSIKYYKKSQSSGNGIYDKLESDYNEYRNTVVYNGRAYTPNSKKRYDKHYVVRYYTKNNESGIKKLNKSLTKVLRFGQTRYSVW